MSWLDVALVSITGLLGATLQGTVGFGMGIVASPFLVLLDERFVPAPILLSTLVLTTFLTLRERHAVDIRGLRWALVGRVVGTVVAGMVLTVLPADRMTVVFGGFVLVGVLMSASGLRFHPHPHVLAGAGMLSGIMGTIASIGGPPMALVYQDADGPDLTRRFYRDDDELPTSEAVPPEPPEPPVEERSGTWSCASCGNEYDPAYGDPLGEVAPDTAFAALPSGWRCPVCDSPPADYQPLPRAMEQNPEPTAKH